MEIKQKTKCFQAGCIKDGVYRYTWPGNDEKVICTSCAPKLRAVAEAMGLYLQLISID